MFNWITLIILLVFVIEAIAKDQAKKAVIEKFKLHLYNNSNQWQYVENMFKNGPIQQLTFFETVIEIDGFKKILSYDLSKLKMLNISNCQMTSEVSRYVFQQDLIYNIQQLIFQSNSLLCEDLQVLKQKQSNLKKISLLGNRISYKGFQYISRVKMNLQSLNINSNSLLYSKSIDALISMNLSNLKQLNVGRTSIQSQNLLKLLNSLDKQKLVNLTIGQNLYSQQFYRQFTKMQFPKLQHLDLFSLVIDDNIWKYFQNFTLPSCKVLRLHQNQLTTAMGIKIITKKNYPKLQDLDLNLNFINSSFITRLRDQNFLFKKLKMRLISMDKNGLLQLSKMDLSLLQYLQYSFSISSPQIVQQFFRKSNLKQIKQINIPALRNAGPIFQHILNANLLNLEKLTLPDIGSFNISLLEKQNIFPKMKKLLLKFIRLDTQIQKKIIQNFHIIAPQLQQFVFSIVDPGYCLQAIFNGSIKFEVKKKIQFTLKYIQNENQIENQMVTFILQPGKPPKIINMMYFNILHNIWRYKFLTGRLSSKIQTLNSVSSKLKIQFMEKYFKNFDFSYLNLLMDDDSYQFLKWYKKNNNNCVFRNLSQIYCSNMTDQNLQIIKKCDFPVLSHLTIDFKKTFQQDQKASGQDLAKQQEKQQKELIQKRINITLPKFPYMIILNIRNANNISLKNIIKQGNYSILRILTISEMKLTSQHLSQIMKSLPSLNKMTTLDISGNYLNNNLTFLRQNHPKLRNFIMDQIVLNLDKHLYKDLCQLDFEFIQLLSLSQIGMDDNFMLGLIQCLKNKNIQNSVIFPRLSNFDISKNYLETKGISELMKLNLPLISSIQFDSNKDPELFNSVFHQKSSKRLVSFTSFRNYFSGIDANIENFTSNTRRLQNLALIGDQILSSDIQILSNFQFDSLTKFATAVKKINSCQSLKHLLKIGQRIKEIYIIMNEPFGLNSSCLDNSYTDNNFRLGNLPNIIYIIIDGPYAQTKNFANFYLDPNVQLLRLVLSGTYVSEQKLVQIFKANKTKYQAVKLTNNNLSDISVEQFLNNELQLLQVLQLDKNQYITSESLKYMENFKYSNLKGLSLSQTSIGDKGIQYLIRNQFPELISLELKNIDLTRIGIQLLNKLKAPNLMELDISCNQLSVDDIALLQVEKFPFLKKILVFPRLSDVQLERLNSKFNKAFANKSYEQQKMKIQIVSDLWYEQIQNLDIVMNQ